MLLRPEGPAFNSHARQGVVEWPQASSRPEGPARHGVLQPVAFAPSALSLSLPFLIHASRAWPLNAGPSGLAPATAKNSLV